MAKSGPWSAIAAFLAVALLVVSAPARPAEMAHRTEFVVLFGAIPVGRATFDIRASADDYYSLQGSGRTVGIVELFAPGKGSVASEGRIVGDHVVATRNSVAFTERRKKSKFVMELDNGAVSHVAYEPDSRKKKDGPKWVPVTEDQLRAVIDPASGLVVPVAPDRAADPHAICDRVLNIYDGDTRYDIGLKYKATKEIRTKGYEGPAHVCQLRYMPVSGHRLKQRNVEYMRRNKNMEIWLAPIADSNLFTPIRVDVPTWIGIVTALPTYFGPIGE